MTSVLETLAERAAGHRPSLPLKLVVVADCAGRDLQPVPVVRGIEGLFEDLRPTLRLNVTDRLQNPGAKTAVDIEFNSIGDFHPESLVRQLPLLADAARASNPALGQQLDDILHHREFQQMEAAWRGLQRLCMEIKDKPEVLLLVLAATRRNLKETFHKAVFEPEYGSEVEAPISAVYLDFRFGCEPAHLALLQALASDCAELQTPMIAATAPEFFQLKNLAHLPNLPDIIEKMQQPAYAGWKKFQTDPVARWTSLTANRYLAREPYALQMDQGGALDYREKAEASHPENYLWAEAGWLILCNLARSFIAYRHCVVIDGMNPDTVHKDLPVRPYPKKANVEVPSPTEILIDDAKAWELVRAGITALVGISDGAVASFPFITNAYRLRPGVMTTESALWYQLFAGNLFHYLLRLYPQIPSAEGADAVTRFVEEKIREFLIPFIDDQAASPVTAELVEVAGQPGTKMLNLAVKPVLKMQGKAVEFTLQIAL